MELDRMLTSSYAMTYKIFTVYCGIDCTRIEAYNEVGLIMTLCEVLRYENSFGCFT